MKKSLRAAAVGMIVLSPAILTAQATASFSDQTSLLPTATFHSGNAIGVVDMNGDKKDDIVRASQNTTQYIEYQANPNSTFTEANFPSAAIGDPWGMCVGDYDNNGYNDVHWGDYGASRILTANSTGTSYTSVNITAATSAPFLFVQGCNFYDVNNDHFLDAFVCNDVDMPQIYVGNGSSSGWTLNNSLMPLATVPVSDNSGNYASIWTDVNNDGLPDLMITHCRQGVSNPSDARRIDQVFINNGNGTYTQDVTNWTGLRDGAQGWSTAWGDIDNDGDMDAFVLNYDVNSKLMLNDGAGVFSNIMSGSGIASTTSIFGENATFQDFNNDGFVDLMISGDHHLVYMNNGNNSFTAISNPFPYSSNQITAHAVGDLNYDGKLDVYASYCDIYNTPSQRNDKLWMNSSNNTNHWIVFDLVGGAMNGYSNKNGVGAIVKIYGPWGVQVREVRAGEAYGIQNSFAVHFGLGSNTAIDSLKIKWPSGIEDMMLSLPADQHYTVNEGGFPLSAVGAKPEALSVSVVPNPMSSEGGVIQLRHFDQYGLDNLSLNVFDVNGKLVMSESSLQQSVITLSNVGTAGMYFYQVNHKNGERVAAGKFIVK